ncbi:MAG: RNase P subunit, partial [Thaumarchaeota archaeon]|nr:RNase P subunit [Nitrososphaerota archaeon]
SSFCKKCKKFIPPGIASKIRLGSKPKSIRITCSYCNHTYRKIISQ